MSGQSGDLGGTDGYAKFLTGKVAHHPDAGFEPGPLAECLFDFQRDTTVWACRKGRAGVFLNTGLGKSLVALEWARQVTEHTGQPVLIVAPLSVAEQTIRLAEHHGLTVPEYAREHDELAEGVSITNYEHMHKFTQVNLAGLVLDESSRLAAEDSATRKLACEGFAHVPYRLACTATPIPNDVAEIANHAEFLGIMTRRDVLGSFFVHDDQGWRLRGHARRPFFAWLASWSVSMLSPADLGYDGSAFELPSLTVLPHIIETTVAPDGQLFAAKLGGVSDRARVRRQTATDRVAETVRIVQSTTEPTIVWCKLNAESTAVAAALGADAVEVAGTDDIETKRERLLGFIEGRYRVLVTKPKIAAFGMNFQHAPRQVFCGIDDSWQTYFQAIRRSWRFGQTRPVTVHVVCAEVEREILDNVRRKEAEADILRRGVVDAVRADEIKEIKRMTVETVHHAGETTVGESWRVVNDDCVEAMRAEPDDSVGLSVFSPPFLALYTYTDSERDMGNCRGQAEFFEHFRYAMTELLRITMPGRIAAIHVAQVSATLGNDGWIGIKDFRGQVVSELVDCGWNYHGEITVDKNPQIQAIRTHSKSLLFVQLRKDASWMRPGLADYVLVMRKPGESEVPVQGDVTHEEWIEWASPVWRGIRETDTLNAAEARGNEDDRHVCPLQLGLIDRAIRLWSNPGDIVFDPFAGIGSSGYVAVKHHRRFVGVELKPLYAQTAVRNLRRADAELLQGTLFAEPVPTGEDHQ